MIINNQPYTLLNFKLLSVSFHFNSLYKMTEVFFLRFEIIQNIYRNWISSFYRISNPIPNTLFCFRENGSSLEPFSFPRKLPSTTSTSRIHLLWRTSSVLGSRALLSLVWRISLDFRRDLSHVSRYIERQRKYGWLQLCASIIKIRNHILFWAIWVSSKVILLLFSCELNI